MTPLRFLITGARAPVALEWVRRLGRAGHVVAAVDSVEHPLCLRSRYLLRYGRVPSARHESLAFARAVKAYAEEMSADFVLPTCEEIFHLARYHSLFNGSVRLLAEPIERLRILHHKGRFAEFAGNLGHAITAPVTHELRSLDELMRFRDIATDWVLKPAYSRFGSHTMVGRSFADWQKVCPSTQQPWIAQRLVSGREYCAYAIAYEGRVTAFSTYHSRYRTRNGYGTSGAGIYFEAIARPDLLEFTCCATGKLRFTGQIAFDFIDDGARTWVLECNPRSTSGLHLLSERDPAPYLTGARPDLWTAEASPKMHATAMLLSRGGLRRWRDFLRAQDVIYAEDDRVPAFYSWQFVRELRQRARKAQISWQEASTIDIDWNGEN